MVMGRPHNRVLVTGGTGYAGSCLLPKLPTAGYGMTVVVTGLADGFAGGGVTNAMADGRYYNIRLMQALKLR